VEDVRSAVFGDAAVVGAIWLFGDRSAPPKSISRGPMTIVYTWTGDRYRGECIGLPNCTVDVGI
jgi:hypothetical protein